MGTATERERLHLLILKKRQAEGLTLRAAAAQCGISPATLMRLEKGDTEPNKDTMLALCKWLGDNSFKKDIESHYFPKENMLVDAHLRAGKELPSELAMVLSKMFKLIKEKQIG